MKVRLLHAKILGMTIGTLLLGLALVLIMKSRSSTDSASRPLAASTASLRQAEVYAKNQLEHFTPPQVESGTSPEQVAEQRIRSFKSLLVTLPKLDRSPYKTKFRKKIFEDLDRDPGVRDLSLQILANPDAAQKMFGKDQGMARVIAIDYLGHLDATNPQENDLIKALQAIHARLEQNPVLDRGTTADLQELYLIYFKHRREEVQENTLDLLANLPFSKTSYEAFRPMIGYYINSMPKSQAIAVLNYIKSRTQTERS